MGTGGNFISFDSHQSGLFGIISYLKCRAPLKIRGYFLNAVPSEKFKNEIKKSRPGFHHLWFLVGPDEVCESFRQHKTGSIFSTNLTVSIPYTISK